MVSTHSERDASPDDQRQNDRRQENKPLDHFSLLPAVLAVRDLVAALLGCALVDGDAVSGRLTPAFAVTSALVFAEICDDLMLTPACCDKALNRREHRQRPRKWMTHIPS